MEKARRRTQARSHARGGGTVAIAASIGEDTAVADAVEVFVGAEAHLVAGDHARHPGMPMAGAGM